MNWFKKFDNSTNYIVHVSVVVMAIIAGLVIFSRQQNWPTDVSEPLGFKRGGVLTEDTITIPPRENPSKPSYDEVSQLYFGPVIQIDNCVATPFDITIKNGEIVMLDGRSSDPQRITIGEKSVVLGSFDFEFMSMVSNNAPETLSINCEALGEGHFNIGTILVQP